MHLSLQDRKIRPDAIDIEERPVANDAKFWGRLGHANPLLRFYSAVFAELWLSASQVRTISPIASRRPSWSTLSIASAMKLSVNMTLASASGMPRERQ